MNVRNCIISYSQEKVSDEFNKYLGKLSNSKATMWHFEGFNDNDDDRCALLVFEYPVNINIEKFEHVKFEGTASSLNDLLYYLVNNSFDHYIDMHSCFQLNLKK